MRAIVGTVAGPPGVILGVVAGGSIAFISDFFTDKAVDAGYSVLGQ